MKDIAQAERWQTAYESITTATADAFIIREQNTMPLYIRILDNIFMLNEGNSNDQKKNEIAQKIKDFSNEYKKSRTQSIRLYLSQLESRNRAIENAYNKAQTSPAKAADAQSSMSVLKAYCIACITYVNTQFSLHISTASIQAKTKGADMVDALVSGFAKIPNEIREPVKKYLIEYILIALMATPLPQITRRDKSEDYFKIQDSSIAKLLKAYGEIFDHIRDSYVSALTVHYLDPFIELSKKEVIALCGTYKTDFSSTHEQKQLHFEIFSETEIMDVPKSLQIIDTNSDAYFQPRHCVEKLKTIIPSEYAAQLQAFNENALRADEIEGLYHSVQEMREVACYHLSEWADIDWMPIFDNSRYMQAHVRIYNPLQKKHEVLTRANYVKTYHMPYMWMSTHVFANEAHHFNKNMAWFYHPLWFISRITGY